MTSARPEPTELARLADTLETETGVARLLGHLFPGESLGLDRAGRYRELERAVRKDNRLRAALFAPKPDTAAITDSWNRYLQRNSRNVALQHTLAVLYRERALARVSDTGGGRALAIAGALWVLLPATDAFRTHIADRPGDAALTDEIAGELIDLNAAQGARALAAGRYTDARDPLEFVHACTSGADAVGTLLNRIGVPIRVTVEQDRLAASAARAAVVIDGWCSDVIADAEKQAKDATAIAKMPKGVRLAYDAGIAVLNPMVRLGVAPPRVLATGLGWYVDWCYDLHGRDDVDGIRTKLNLARTYATNLGSVTKKGRGDSLDGQLLSEYHKFLGFVAPDPHQAVREYETSLEWDPANANTRGLIEEAQLDRAGSLAMEGSYDEAVADLRAALRRASDTNRASIEQMLASVLNAWAVQFCDAADRSPYGPVASEKTERAIRLLEEAVELQPRNTTILHNLREALSMVNDP